MIAWHIRRLGGRLIIWRNELFLPLEVQCLPFMPKCLHFYNNYTFKTLCADRVRLTIDAPASRARILPVMSIPIGWRIYMWLSLSFLYLYAWNIYLLVIYLLYTNKWSQRGDFMLTVCLTLINDDEDKKSFEQLVKKFEKKLYTESCKIFKKKKI